MVLEMMLRVAVRVHIPGSSVITILHTIIMVSMIVIVTKRGSRRTLLVIIVMMHFGLHRIRMNSMMHRRLTAIVHIMIVLRTLVLVLMTWISLVHIRRTRMVTMVFRTPHGVILSNMRHWWRLTLMLLLGLEVVRVIGSFLSSPILGTLSAILTSATNGNRYTWRNRHLWLLLLLLWKTWGGSSANRFHSPLRRKGMVLLMVKVSSRSSMLHMTLLLLLHVHVVHSVLFTTSRTLLNGVSPMRTNQSLLLMVEIVVVRKHVRMINSLLL